MSTTSSVDLLRQAESSASPKTRRIAKRLGVLAGVSLLLTLCITLAPPLLDLAGPVALAGYAAMLNGAQVLASMLGTGLKIFVEVVLFSWQGPVLAFVGVGVHLAWHRSRVHVMHEAVRLALASKISREDGTALTAGFHRTHNRLFVVLSSTLLLCAIAALMNAFHAFPSGSAQSESSHLLYLVAWTVLAAWLAMLPLKNELSSGMVGAFALVESCPLPEKELIESAKQRATSESQSNGVLNDALTWLQVVGLASTEKDDVKLLLDKVEYVLRLRK